MTLRELLHYIDFDVEKVTKENGKQVLKLIDLQGAYLGNIDEEGYLPSAEDIPNIIDRCEIYWNDYVITPLCEDIGCDEDEYWTDIYEKAVKHYGKKDVDKNTILKYLIYPELVTLDAELLPDAPMSAAEFHNQEFIDIGVN